MLQNRPYVLERKGRKFVLLEKVVEVLLQHLEDQTGMRLVLETLVGAHKVELIRIFLTESRQDGDLIAEENEKKISLRSAWNEN